MKKFVNFLTILRFCITFILPFMWKNMNSLLFVIIVAIILLTDFFDGMLARHYHVQCLFGAVSDMIADKFFGIVILIIIANYYKTFYLVVLMEIIISLINIIAGIRGAVVKSSFLGKFKMWILGLTILCGIFFINYNYFFDMNIANTKDSIMECMIYLLIGSEIMVSVDYIKRIVKYLNVNKRKKNYKFKNKKDLKIALFDTEYYLANKDKPLFNNLTY